MVTTNRTNEEILAGQETVFIVEDDAGARDAMGELIRTTGARVETFNSAEEFLSKVRIDSPSCVLIDEKLPGIDGCELLKQLSAEGKRIPAVFVTAFATTAMTVNAMQLGAVNVLDKPCGELELRSAVKQALANDRTRLRRSGARLELAARLDTLSKNETDVLVQVLDGVPNKQIARQLGVCIRTIEARRSKIYKTMGVKSVAELVRACVSAGFIDA